MMPGDKVRLIANPGRVGILSAETDGPSHRQRLLVNFLNGEEQFVLAGSLEKVEQATSGPYQLMAAGRYGRASDLRGATTYYRLSRSGHATLNSSISGNSGQQAGPKEVGPELVFNGQEISALNPISSCYQPSMS